MIRLRFPVSAFALSLAFSALGPASAQEAGKIEDIQISQADGAVSILVKLSQQPKSAAASQSGGALVLELDGIALSALDFDPAGEALVRHVAVSPAAAPGEGSKIRLEGVAFGAASTTIYRNAVLIETKLAEPSLPAGASLMTPGAKARPTSAVGAKPLPPAQTSIAPTQVAAKPTAAPPAPAATPASTQPPVPLVPAKPDESKPASKKPADIIDARAEAKNALQSHPLPPPPVSAKPLAPVQAASTAAPTGPSLAVAAMINLDAAACAGAEAQLAKDAWYLPALGDHALCLIDQQKYAEAKNRLDQLAAFSPEDWRVVLGRAALAEHNHDDSAAEIGYRSAETLAPDQTARDAITRRLAQMAVRPAS